MIINVLLVEDREDAPRLQKLLESLGACSFVVVGNLNQASYELQNKSRSFDWVIINPEAGGVTIARELFDDAIDRLQKIAGDAKIFVLERQNGDPTLKQAIHRFVDARKEVQIIRQDDRSVFAAEFEQTVKRKSGGDSDTLRVEQARIEGKIARLEGYVEDLKDAQSETIKITSQLSSSIAETRIEIGFLKDQIKQLGASFQRLASELDTVADVAESVAANKPEPVSDREGLKFAIGLAGAIITAIAASPALTHIVQVFFPKKPDPPTIEQKK